MTNKLNIYRNRVSYIIKGGRVIELVRKIKDAKFSTRHPHKIANHFRRTSGCVELRRQSNSKES